MEVKNLKTAYVFLEFQMVTKSLSKAYILLKICTQRFSKSLIKVLLLDFQNSKWQIQYGGKKIAKILDCAQNWYTEVFEGADFYLSKYNFDLTIQKSTLVSSEIHGFGGHIIFCSVKYIYP